MFEPPDPTSRAKRKHIEKETGIFNDVESYLGLGLLAAVAGAVLIIWPVERKDKVREREKERVREMKRGKRRDLCFDEGIGEAGFVNGRGKSEFFFWFFGFGF